MSYAPTPCVTTSVSMLNLNLLPLSQKYVVLDTWMLPWANSTFTIPTTSRKRVDSSQNIVYAYMKSTIPILNTLCIWIYIDSLTIATLEFTIKKAKTWIKLQPEEKNCYPKAQKKPSKITFLENGQTSPKFKKVKKLKTFLTHSKFNIQRELTFITICPSICKKSELHITTWQT